MEKDNGKTSFEVFYSEAEEELSRLLYQYHNTESEEIYEKIKDKTIWILARINGKKLQCVTERDGVCAFVSEIEAKYCLHKKYMKMQCDAKKVLIGRTLEYTDIILNGDEMRIRRHG